MRNEEYAVIVSLNGNFILKSADKVKVLDYVEIEIYADSLEDAKKQFKEHKKILRKEGLI